MQWRLEGAGEALRSPIPWVALSAALALTATGWIGLERNRYEEARAAFAAAAELAGNKREQELLRRRAMDAANAAPSS